MSTRATITVADDQNSFDLYRHYDGYPDGPHGVVRHIAMAQRLAWDLPRFEAADFAAAIIAVLKDRGGSTYLTNDAELHADRNFHYRVEPLCDDVATSVHLTITKPSWPMTEPDVEVFAGSIQDAVQQFDAETPIVEQPRELQILGPVAAALYRAEEDICQWFKDTPEEDTRGSLDDIQEAGRKLLLLSHHLEKASPWEALAKAQTILKNLPVNPANRDAGLAKTEIHLAMEAHRRFQRD